VHRLGEAAAETLGRHHHLGDDRDEKRDDHGHPRTDEPCRNHGRDNDLQHGGHRADVQHSGDVVLPGVHRRDTARGVQDDRPQRGVRGERDLGHPNRPEGQHRDRHQRNGWNRAQKVHRRHRIATYLRYQPDGQPERSAERHADGCRHDRDTERVRDAVDEYATACQIHERGQHFSR